MKNLVEKVFYFQNQLKLKHWQETSGYTHKLLGDYYEKLDEQFDLLVECYISNSQSITAAEEAYVLINHIGMIETYQVELSKFLLGMRDIFENRPELINIIDDILTLVAKYNYLLSKN